MKRKIILAYCRHRDLLNLIPFSRTIASNLLWQNFNSGSSLKIALSKGQNIKINPKDQYVSQTLFLEGVYEPGTTEVISQKLSEDDTFIDIGANIGYFSLIAMNSLGKKGEIFAFEPDSDNFAILEQNMALEENTPNIQLEEKAVSNKVGDSKLYLQEKNKGGHSIKSKTESWITVNSTSLDKYQNFYSADMIKMDIEGSEPEAIRGMKNLIKNHHPKIIMEFYPDLWESKECLDFLKSEDYDFHVIDERNRVLQSVKHEDIVSEKLDYRLPVNLYSE